MNCIQLQILNMQLSCKTVYFLCTIMHYLFWFAFLDYYEGQELPGLHRICVFMERVDEQLSDFYHYNNYNPSIYAY